MMQLMRDEEDGLVFEESSDAAVEELLAHLAPFFKCLDLAKDFGSCGIRT